MGHQLLWHVEKQRGLCQSCVGGCSKAQLPQGSSFQGSELSTHSILQQGHSLKHPILEWQAQQGEQLSHSPPQSWSSEVQCSAHYIALAPVKQSISCGSNHYKGLKTHCLQLLSIKQVTEWSCGLCRSGESFVVMGCKQDYVVTCEKAWLHLCHVWACSSLPNYNQPQHLAGCRCRYIKHTEKYNQIWKKIYSAPFVDHVFEYAILSDTCCKDDCRMNTMSDELAGVPKGFSHYVIMLNTCIPSRGSLCWHGLIYTVNNDIQGVRK